MRILILSLIFCIHLNSKAQIADQDLTIVFNNIGEEYQKKFIKKKYEFINAINSLNLPSEMGKVELLVEYVNGQGYITTSFLYNHLKLFTDSSQYKEHYNEWSRVAGKGNSIYLQSLVFQAISHYKYRLGLAYGDDTFINFINVVKFKKSNEDWMEFYSRNNIDSYGMMTTTMYDNILFTYNNQKYDIRCGNVRTYNQAKYFVCNKITGIDGKKTGYYYFLKFFDL